MSHNIKQLSALTIICMVIFTTTLFAQNKIELTDPEIASVAVTANQIDVDYAQIAKKKSKNADILDFAQTMINDHKSIISQAVALAKKLNVTPKDNKLTEQLLDGAKKTTKMLNSKEGNAFNEAYINNEVEYHKAVISTVKDVLIPQTKNEELKQLLQKVLPLLNAHLEHAKAVQSEMQSQNKIKLTDPEIASVAVTANQIDIGYAQIAKKKSKNADILDFAQTMINDHKAIIDQAVALAKKLNVTPKDNKLTEQLLDGAEKTKDMLNSKEGKAFNEAYINNEVDYHKAVISTVENVLIPQTKNEELKQLLKKVMPLLNGHLEHAKAIQSKLQKETK